MPDPVHQQLHEALSDDLNRIAARFRPGAKLTLVVRNPEIHDDAGVVISNDDPEAAIAEIRKLERTGIVTEDAPKPTSKARR